MMIDGTETITEAMVKMKDLNAGIMKINMVGFGVIIFVGTESAKEVIDCVESLEQTWEESR